LVVPLFSLRSLGMDLEDAHIWPMDEVVRSYIPLVT
jgi:hypothetical protein